jgi:diacylglycerol kinase family enzyme
MIAPMRRAVLIVNPYSTSVTPARVAEVEAVLAQSADVVTRATEARGHATELAAEAAASADAVVVFSGDGTYNEAINGAAGVVPFGFLPGGGTSVLPRALGLPRDPAAAAERVGAALVEGRTRGISLGRVNGRRFCFAAGIGLDAELVRRVDRLGRGANGQRPGTMAFVAALLKLLAADHLHIQPQLEVGGRGRAAFLFVANGHPYTYAGPQPVVVSRTASFEEGLDYVAVRELTPAAVPAVLVRALRGTLRDSQSVFFAHDVDRIEVHCERPLPLQADGEDLGDVTDALFESERDALEVLV